MSRTKTLLKYAAGCWLAVFVALEAARLASTLFGVAPNADLLTFMMLWPLTLGLPAVVLLVVVGLEYRRRSKMASPGDGPDRR